MNMRVVIHACGKKLYRSWDHASHDAMKLRKDKSEPKAAYWCRRCHAFHVGTPLGKEQGNIMARTKAAKLKAKRTRGRPRMDGVREPNGRLSRSGTEHEAANAEPVRNRALRLGISRDNAMDQKAGTFIGYLNILGPRDGLSDAQYEGAQSFLTFRERYLRAIKAPAAIYDPEATGAGGEITEAYEQWCKSIKREMITLRNEIQDEQNYSRENLWAALDLVIIGDRHFHHMIGATRILCNVLARHFKSAGENRSAA